MVEGRKISKISVQFGRSVVSDSATPWTVALQDSLSMGILQARILEWVGISFFRNLPEPGIKPGFLALQADS